MKEYTEEKKEKKKSEKKGKFSDFRTGWKTKKVGSRILDLLCALSGCFFLLVYILYFLWQAPRGRTADICVSLLVFGWVLLPFALRKFIKKGLKRAYIPLKILWCSAMCFYMISFTVFCAVIYGHGDIPYVRSDRQEVVIVFGCQVHENGNLSAELKSRLDRAAQILEEYPHAVCVVSGGRGDDEPTSEAWAMKNYLSTVKGVAAERILTEEQSKNTVENIKFSAKKLQDAGYDLEECSFICVSSSFHTPRIYLLCSRFGMKDCSTVSADSPYPFLEFIYTVREYMSYVHLLLFGA